MLYTSIMEEFVDSFFNTGDKQNMNTNEIKYDMNDKSYKIIIPMVGVDKNDISIKEENYYLSVNSKEGEYGHSYDYKFSLSKKLNIEDITAEYKNGLLVVEIPLIENKSKTIEVK